MQNQENLSRLLWRSYFLNGHSLHHCGSRRITRLVQDSLVPNRVSGERQESRHSAFDIGKRCEITSGAILREGREAYSGEGDCQHVFSHRNTPQRAAWAIVLAGWKQPVESSAIKTDLSETSKLHSRGLTPNRLTMCLG